MCGIAGILGENAKSNVIDDMLMVQHHRGPDYKGKWLENDVALGHNRLSIIDLIPNGSSWEEVIILAKEIEKAGANILNSGIGWHEARIPTIATSVPKKAFSWITKKLYGNVSIPIIASNRINSPEIAEEVLSENFADLVFVECFKLERHLPK